LDPEDFQRQLAQRTAEEQAKMAEFRAHEEKMKKYQEAKKKGGRPPLGKEGSSLQVNT
jgi:hypothetical protein